MQDKHKHKPRCQLFLMPMVIQVNSARWRPNNVLFFYLRETCWGGSQLSLPLPQIFRNKILGPLVTVPESPHSFLFREISLTKQNLISLFSRGLSCCRHLLLRSTRSITVGGEFLLHSSFWKRCSSLSPASFFWS